MVENPASFKAGYVSILIFLSLLTPYPNSYSYLQLRNKLIISKINPPTFYKLKTIGNLVKSDYFKDYTFCIFTTHSVATCRQSAFATLVFLGKPSMRRTFTSSVISLPHKQCYGFNMH